MNLLEPNTEALLVKRYYLKDEQGEPVEDWPALCHRVAKAIATAEDGYVPSQEESIATMKVWEDKFYNALVNMDFLPGSPTLMNAGTDAGTLSSCFVLEIPDTMEGILDSVKWGGLIHKYGGGTGYYLGNIRPKDTPIKSTQGRACGPVSVIRMLSVIGNEITQGGKRNGANMALLPISHPDILEFISAKEVDGSLFNFNFSVAISDSVMKGVERGDENPIFESLVDHAWANGEPGVLFPDTVNAANSTPKLGLLLGVNPCGEMPLYTFESCALGSINLLNFFKPPTEPWSGPHEDWVKVSIDWDRFQDTIRTAVRFLDNGIDVNLFPLPQITEASRRLRKIGLGVMGFADLLLRLKIPYGSPHSIDLARVLARTLTETAIYVSQQLAIERGNFPAWKESRYAEEPFATPMRNALCTTIAPTGSISMIANVSPGIEPVYAYEWTKTVMEGTKLEYSHPFYKEHKDEEDYAGVFVSAHDVTPTEHIEMQAAWQEFIHNAISKTANMPETATREDVKAAYILAWKLGCKGLTVYRDGSRSGQVYEKVEEKITEVEQAALEGDADARAGRFVPEAEVFPEESPDVELEGRPRYTVGVTGHFPTGCGTLHLTVNEYPTDTPFELYATMGHSGGCAISMLEAIGRLISMALTNGEPIEDIVHHLKGISCPMKCYDDGKLNLSCSDVIARMLTENPGVEQVFHSYKKVEPWQAPTNGKKKAVLEALAMPEKMRTGGGICFMCGQDSIVFQDGCKSCTSCGESFCG